jgi:signal transduction histidine kinase
MMPTMDTGRGRWRRLPPWRDLPLPLLLGFIDLAVVLMSSSSGRVGAVVQTGVLVIVPTALWWRRIAPGRVLAVVLVTLTAAMVVLPDGIGYALGFADAIALYSLSVHRTRRLAVWGLTAVVVCQPGQFLAIQDLLGWSSRYLVFYVLAGSMGYCLVFVLGRSRRRWHATRDAVTARLATADAERRFAAAAERGRLARELHDVTAHQLTSVIVYATGALRLAASRPQAVGQALELAASAGRESIEALRRLVKVIDEPDATVADDGSLQRVDELVAAFLRLGQPVHLEVTGRPPALPVAVAAAGHRIVQESLTNALRYATGSRVRVGVEYRTDAIRISVDDDGTDGETAAVAGAGHGIMGMSERARAVGGTLTAGPRQGGGWSVEAVLPLSDAGQPATGRSPRWYRSATEPTIDALVAITAGLVVLFFAVIGEQLPELPRLFATVPYAAGLILVISAQSAALLWRRHAPVPVWAGVLVVDCLWMLAIWTGLVHPDSMWLVTFTLIVKVVCLYSIGAFHRRWWPGPVAALVTGPVLVAVVTGAQRVTDPAGELPGLTDTLAVTAAVGGLLLVAWGIGRWLRRRRQRALGHDQELLRSVAAGTAKAIQVERSRLADGLQDSVLAHVHRLVAAAEDGLGALAQHRGGDAHERLRTVCEHGRGALATMRALLGGLHDDTDAGDHLPQPTAEGIADLCVQHRGRGRVVALRVYGDPRPLPTAADLAAYRVAEAVLGTGWADELTLTLDYEHGRLRLAVRARDGQAPGGVALAAVRERVDAVGGTLTVRPDGDGWYVQASFPTPEPAVASPLVAT